MTSIMLLIILPVLMWLALYVIFVYFGAVVMQLIRTITSWMSEAFNGF